MSKSEPASAEIEDAFQRALALHRQGRLAEAEPLYRDILRRTPAHFGALQYLGVLEGQRGNYDAAVRLIGRALEVDPGAASAHTNLGAFLRMLGRHAEALASLDRALAIKRDYPEALHNRGNVLRELGRPEEALASYDAAIALRPGYAEAHYSRANALIDLGRHRDALAAFERALAINPNFVDAWVNRGSALLALKRADEARASYDRALALKPDWPAALYNRGIALAVRGRLREAARDFERVLALDPGHGLARGHLLRAKLDACDWSGYDAEVAAVTAAVRAGERVIEPLSFLAVSGDPADQLLCAQSYVREVCPASAEPLWRGERYGHGKIRLAYLSADFYDHPTAYLTAGLFEAHDRGRFETVAVSFGPEGQSGMRARLEAAFDRFISVGGKSDREVAQMLRDMEADIAVDLMGFTTDSRPGILALRPAPVQVNYLGYLATMGAGYIDYILADPVVIPESGRRHYAEKVVYLPDTYQANDSKKRISERTPSRAEAGLPETGFVFCSFNNTYKIAPDVFEIWMRLLKDVERSVLWLLESNAEAPGNLRREAAARGVDPKRLVFAPRVGYEDYLARYRLADLFLDTLPYNAGATASDALFAGLPVLTRLGTSFSGRMAASLLGAIGLPELVTGSPGDYEALALKLATDPGALSAIKARLSRNRFTHALFDTARFCRHVEAAYARMWELSGRGAPPESFAIPPA